MHAFEEYLKHHNLDALTVSIKARVRYVTVWNVTRGNPITAEQAQKIRQATLALTGIPYDGPLAVIQRNPVEQLPSLTFKITRR